VLSIPKNDFSLVRGALAGRAGDFETLVSRYQRKAHAIARALGVPSDAVDDVVQESFLEAYRDLPRLRALASFGHWFLKIVRNVARKQLERARRSRASGLDEEVALAGGEPVEVRDLREHVRRRILELPEDLREAVFLYYYEGESVREAAAALGLSRSGMRRRLERARATLREKLWRELGDSLRASLPPGTEWTRKCRQVSLLILAIPAAQVSRAEAALGPAAMLTQTFALGALAMKKKAILVSALLALLLFWLSAPFFTFLQSPKKTRGEPLALTPGAARPGAPEPRTAPSAARERRPEDAKEQGTEPSSEESALEAEDEASYGSLLVRVIWGDDKMPAPGVGAHVIAWGSPNLYVDDVEKVTGADGTFHLDRLWKGGGSVIVDRGGSTGFQVNPGEETEVTVEVAVGINAEGIVVDPSGDPIADAAVWVSYPGHTSFGVEMARTGPDGTFQVRSIAKESYVGARARMREPSPLLYLGDKEPEKESGLFKVRLVLERLGGAVRGRVVTANGDPIVGAKVLVGAEYPSYRFHADGTSGLSAPPHLLATNDKGEFQAESVLAGDTPILVRSPGFTPYSESVVVREGATTETTISLERGVTLKGIVRTPEGTTPGARVVIGDWRKFLGIKVFSGSGGAYQLRGVPSGEVEVYAEHKDWGKASARLRMEPGLPARWDPLLTKDLSILGKVVDELGFPLEGWTAMLEEILAEGRRIATQSSVKTDSQGRFHFDGLSDITYRIAFFEPDSSLACATLENVRPGDLETTCTILSAARSSAYLTGTVLDVAGKPVEEARVKILSGILGVKYLSTEKGAGSFHLGPVPPGPYRVEVDTKGLRPVTTDEREVKREDTLDFGPIWLRT